MQLKNFQLSALKSLFEAMDKPTGDIILKSPTGSGKTIILTYFMHQYVQSYRNTVFVWLTPGKGNLEEQSKEKMDKYIHAAQTKLLSDVMTGGFEENDNCFINWEKLTKKGNNALKDSERTNFLEHIEHALNAGLHFIVIVDESHQNNTVKADEIIQYFHTDKIIRCSATPKGINNAEIIEIPEADVIAEGLIKKMLIINEDFPQRVEMENATNYLLEQAYAKQRKIRAEFLSVGKDINPLIVVQIPNKSEKLQDDVERWFETQGITYENGQLAVWLSDMHENLEGIEEINAPSVAVIIKQAVATGWDCPRAAILVKLRDNMDETFEIQTIGRIRRMPEAHHYSKDLLDSCYLYTFDEKFTAGVKRSLGKGALEAATLFLKNGYKGITLTSEQRTMVTDHCNPKKALLSVAKYFEEKFKTGTNKAENKARLQTTGFEFSTDILRHTLSGETATLDFASADMNTIIRKLFDRNFTYSRKILAMEPREVYAFVINNADLLRHTVREAMAAELEQLTLDIDQVSKTPFHIPQSCLFTYDGTAKTQLEMKKNVYQGYLSSAEVRSSSERKFEKFCEKCDAVEWVYKNGDKGNEYLSIVYADNSDKQKNFYPDYIISVNGEVWIVETKGGFDRSGNSQDIDIFTPKKFAVLKDYLERYSLKGGIVRYDEKSEELCICMDSYSEDINSDSWVVLSDILK